MGFWGALKKIGKGVSKGAQMAAPIAGMASAFVPGIPPIAVIMLQKAAAAANKAETTFPASGTGQQKFQWATRTVSDTLPVVAEIEKLAGRNIVDEAAFNRAIQLSVELQVQIAKAMGAQPGVAEAVGARQL